MIKGWEVACPCRLGVERGQSLKSIPWGLNPRAAASTWVTCKQSGHKHLPFVTQVLFYEDICLCSLLMFTTTLGDWYYIYPHFSERKLRLRQYQLLARVVEHLGLQYITWGNANWYNHFWKNAQQCQIMVNKRKLYDPAISALGVYTKEAFFSTKSMFKNVYRNIITNSKSNLTVHQQ